MTFLSQMRRLFEGGAYSSKYGMYRLFCFRDGPLEKCYGLGKINQKRIHAKKNAPKKSSCKAKTEEKKILAEGDLTFKVKCQALVSLKIPFV